MSSPHFRTFVVTDTISALITMCILSWLCKLFTPEWLTAIGTVGSVAVALLLALWGEEIRRLVVRPKLSLRARVQRPDSEKTQRMTIDGQYAGAAYFFRLAVRNRGNIAAQNVQVFLARVDRVTGNKVEKLDQFTPMNLLWAYRGNATLPTLLPDMPPVYCDLAHIDQPVTMVNLPGLILNQTIQGAVLVLDVEFPPNTLGHMLTAGTYHFHLILAASNCRPRNYKLEVAFSGIWIADEIQMFTTGFKMHAI
jgi:hypothetical protein